MVQLVGALGWFQRLLQSVASIGCLNWVVQWIVPIEWFMCLVQSIVHVVLPNDSIDRFDWFVRLVGSCGWFMWLVHAVHPNGSIGQLDWLVRLVGSMDE